MNFKARAELSVGIFIIIGFVILVSFVFLIKDFKIIKPGYRFDIVFGFANGVKVGSPVRLSGVDVGEVKGLKFFYDEKEQGTKVDMRVWVSEDAKIPKDSQVWINTLGLLGEKYIEIFSGKDFNNLIRNDEIIAGQDPVPMEEITKEVKKLVLRFEEALGGMNTILTKINSGEGSFGRFIYSDVVYKNLEELSDDLRRHPWKLFIKTKEKTKKQ